MKHAQLADLLRPENFDGIVGQEHLFGERGVIRRMLAGGRITNMIFFVRDIHSVGIARFELKAKLGPANIHGEESFIGLFVSLLVSFDLFKKSFLSFVFN